MLRAIVLCMAMACCACGGAEPLTVMSFNVLCSACGGGEPFDPWEDRLHYEADVIKRYGPDLIGFQEIAFASEVDEISKLNRAYDAIFYQTGEESYADATIFYRRDRFTVNERGFFWLSPTPDVALSTGFSGGPQLPRLLAWAKLRDLRSDEDLFFATTHFDNNAPSQEKSAPLVLERLAPFASMPMILTGDFNSEPADVAYHTLAEGTGFHFANAFDLNGQFEVATNQSPAPAFDVEQRIDHLFLAGDGVEWSCPKWTVDQYVYGDMMRFPSDHFAIAATLQR